MRDKVKAGTLFWVIGALLLIWGLVGVSMYILEMTMSEAAYLEYYGQEAADVRHLIPTWSIAGYAIGVWTGLAGTVLLLLRKSLALWLYFISSLGAITGWGWYIINPKASAMMSANGGWYMMALVIALCLFSIWWARKNRASGTLT